jgi:hypothetical protein
MNIFVESDLTLNIFFRVKQPFSIAELLLSGTMGGGCVDKDWWGRER